MSGRNWTFLVSAAALLLATRLTTPAAAQQAGVQQQLAGESVLEQIKRNRKLRMGIALWQPWLMRSKKGEIIGFNADLINQLAKDIGVEVEYVPSAWDGLIPGLLAKKYDAIMTVLFATPKRALTVNFTIPYNHSGYQMVVNKEKTKSLKYPDGYNGAGITLACLRGAASCGKMQERFPKSTVRPFDDQAQLMQEVLNGNAHALVTTTPLPALMVLEHPNVLAIPDPEVWNRQPEGFMVRKGDPDMLAFLDTWIRYYESLGWLESRRQYWFNTRDWVDQVAEGK